MVLASIEAQDNSQGPVLSEGFLDGLIRQSMTIDLSDLKEGFTKEPAVQQRRPQSQPVLSKAEPVDIATLLEAFDPEIEAVEAGASQRAGALSTAHAEDVSSWTRGISPWLELRQSSKPVLLIQLQQKLQIPLVDLWLGLLLSQPEQYQLEQHGEFYTLDSICLVRKKIIASVHR